MPASEPAAPKGIWSRPSGQPTIKDKRLDCIDQTETVDLEQYSNGKDHGLFGKVTNEYESVVNMTHGQRDQAVYGRRWYCGTYKKQIRAPIPMLIILIVVYTTPKNATFWIRLHFYTK